MVENLKMTNFVIVISTIFIIAIFGLLMWAFLQVLAHKETLEDRIIDLECQIKELYEKNGKITEKIDKLLLNYKNLLKKRQK